MGSQHIIDEIVNAVTASDVVYLLYWLNQLSQCPGASLNTPHSVTGLNALQTASKEPRSGRLILEILLLSGDVSPLQGGPSSCSYVLALQYGNATALDVFERWSLADSEVPLLASELLQMDPWQAEKRLQEEGLESPSATASTSAVNVLPPASPSEKSTEDKNTNDSASYSPEVVGFAPFSQDQPPLPPSSRDEGTDERKGKSAWRKSFISSTLDAVKDEPPTGDLTATTPSSSPTHSVEDSPIDDHEPQLSRNRLSMDLLRSDLHSNSPNMGERLQSTRSPSPEPMRAPRRTFRPPSPPPELYPDRRHGAGGGRGKNWRSNKGKRHREWRESMRAEEEAQRRLSSDFDCRGGDAIFLDNLPSSVAEKQLYRIASRLGSVSDVLIPATRYGRKRIGFLQMHDARAHRMVLEELDGLKYDGTVIRARHLHEGFRPDPNFPPYHAGNTTPPCPNPSTKVVVRHLAPNATLEDVERLFLRETGLVVWAQRMVSAPHSAAQTCIVSLGSYDECVHAITELDGALTLGNEAVYVGWFVD